MTPRRLHTITVALAVPGLALRVLLVLICGAVALAFGVSLFWQALVVGAALLAAVLPRTRASWLVVALIPLGMLFSPAELWRTCLAVLAVHLIHVLGSLSTVIPALSRLQLRALWPSARRFLGIQALSQALVLLMAFVLEGLTGADPWFAPLGALALVLLTVVLIRPLRRAG